MHIVGYKNPNFKHGLDNKILQLLLPTLVLKTRIFTKDHCKYHVNREKVSFEMYFQINTKLEHLSQLLPLEEQCSLWVSGKSWRFLFLTCLIKRFLEYKQYSSFSKAMQPGKKITYLTGFFIFHKIAETSVTSMKLYQDIIVVTHYELIFQFIHVFIVFFTLGI